MLLPRVHKRHVSLRSPQDPYTKRIPHTRPVQNLPLKPMIRLRPRPYCSTKVLYPDPA